MSRTAILVLTAGAGAILGSASTMALITRYDLRAADPYGFTQLRFDRWTGRIAHYNTITHEWTP